MLFYLIGVILCHLHIYLIFINGKICRLRIHWSSKEKGKNNKNTRKQKTFYFQSNFTFTFWRSAWLSTSNIGFFSKWNIPAIILVGIVCTDIL